VKIGKYKCGCVLSLGMGRYSYVTAAGRGIITMLAIVLVVVYSES